MKCTKNHRLTYTKRAQRIVSSLTLEEKVSLMGGNVSLKEMMADLTADANNHYNYIPYSAGGIERQACHQCFFATVQEVWFAEQEKVPVFRYPC